MLKKQEKVKHFLESEKIRQKIAELKRIKQRVEDMQMIKIYRTVIWETDFMSNGIMADFGLWPIIMKHQQTKFFLSQRFTKLF